MTDPWVYLAMIWVPRGNPAYFVVTYRWGGWKRGRNVLMCWN